MLQLEIMKKNSILQRENQSKNKPKNETDSLLTN